MKNMKLIFMACLLVLLAACSSKPAPEEDKKSGAPQAENDMPREEAGVKAEVKLEDDSEEAKLTLKNSSDKEVGTGVAFTLEKWDDGKWDKVNPDQMFTEQMIMVKAGENYEQTIELKDQEAGTYRVAKTFFAEEEKHEVAVVFEKK
jgi:major membrane immunogen (membrane-anchored lipoprotein)